MHYKNFGGISSVERVDCTVYTFALFSHAIQTFGWCVCYKCVYIFISPYCAPHTKGLVTVEIVFSLEKY